MTSTSLVLLAHPDGASFNAQWFRASRDACAARGHRVLQSDLYAMGFDPAERAAHYPDPPDRFDVLRTQDKAAKSGTLPGDAAAEIAKIRAADRLILHFPLWWFGPPAMLKGWCDRCLPHGAMHSSAERFDSGRFRGRRVLFCVTGGSSDTEHAPDGKEGDARLLLWPLAYTFRYLGFDILDPVVMGGVHGFHGTAGRAELAPRLQDALATQHDRVAGMDTAPVWPFNADTDFDGAGRLHPGAPSPWPFIRQT